MKVAAAILSTLALAAASPASAAEYVVNFGSPFGAFDATFTTTPDPDPNFDLVTAINGTLAGNAVTLYPVTPGVGSDNLFSPTSPYFTNHGIVFLSNNLGYFLFTSAGSLTICSALEQCERVTNFTVESPPQGVPEPATWAMMLIGFGAVGFAMRRAKSELGAASHHA